MFQKSLKGWRAFFELQFNNETHWIWKQNKSIAFGFCIKILQFCCNCNKNETFLDSKSSFQIKVWWHQHKYFGVILVINWKFVVWYLILYLHIEHTLELPLWISSLVQECSCHTTLFSEKKKLMTYWGTLLKSLAKSPFLCY